MQYTSIFFDVDDTLYPPSSGLWESIRKRMSDYMFERVGIPRTEIPTLRRYYYKTYGTTLRGLQIDYQIDPDDFLAYVHDLPIEDMVKPDPQLQFLLSSLRQQKYVFTNADANHAKRVLLALGVEHCFEGIIDINKMDFFCKPDHQAYQAALSYADERDPQQCVYLDDSARNLAPAYEMGFCTILVGANGADPVAHHSILSLKDLRSALPELWM